MDHQTHIQWCAVVPCQKRDLSGTHADIRSQPVIAVMGFPSRDLPSHHHRHFPTELMRGDDAWCWIGSTICALIRSCVTRGVYIRRVRLDPEFRLAYSLKT